MSDEPMNFGERCAANDLHDTLHEKHLLARCLQADAAVAALTENWPRTSTGYKVRANEIRAALERAERALGEPYFRAGRRLSHLINDEKMSRADRTAAIDALARQLDAELAAVPTCED